MYAYMYERDRHQHTSLATVLLS